MKLRSPLLVAWAILVSVLRASSEPLEHWNWLSPMPTGLPLRLLHFDGQAFLAGGARMPSEVLDPNYVAPKADALIRSVDGSNWVVVQTITNGPVVRIQSDAGEVIAFTRGEAWRSPDGVHWTVQSLRLPSIDSRDFYWLGRANGRFVAVRATFAMDEEGRPHHGQFVSVDGVNWKLTGALADGATQLGIVGLEYGNGHWVELMTYGQVFVSADGENWASGAAVSPGVIHPRGYFLQFEAGEFFAGVASGRLARSTDGLNWTEWFTGQFRSLNGVARGPDAWVISADGGRTALRTTDFSTAEWIEIQTKAFSTMYEGTACRYGNGRFVSVSDGTVSISHRRSGQIHTSPDGRIWTQQNPVVSNYTTSRSAQGNGRIVAVGSSAIDAHGNVGISEDGTSWRFVDVNVPYPLQSVVFGAGRFVATGSPHLNTDSRIGSLLSSTNGVDWLQQFEYTNSSGLVFGNGQFLMATRSNLLVSRDGLDWEQRPLPDELIAAGLIFGGNQFVGGIINGGISRSRDGLNWTRQEIAEARGRTFFPGTYGQGLFVQCSGDGAVVTSSDGENWQVMEKALPSYGFGMTYGRGWFVAATFKMHDSALYASQDGLHWTRVLESVGEVIQHLSFYGERFLAFGDGSTVLQSAPLPAVWEPSLRLVGRSSRRFQVGGTPNQRHRVEVSTQLDTPVKWRPQLDLLLPDSGVIEFELPPPSQGAEFYRVVR